MLGRLLGRRYEVTNYGVSGRTLLDIPGKSYRDTGYINEVKAGLPDILIVMLGSNDSRSGRWNAKKYKQAYLALLKELQNNREQSGDFHYGAAGGVSAGERRDYSRHPQ